MTATVAVVGGGYGGVTAAQALDDVANVVLIDPKDSFVHNVASLRSIVDPNWADRMYMSYEGALKNGTVIQDWAVSVDPGGVQLSESGYVNADYIILATGTTYPFPAKIGNYHANSGRHRIRRANTELAKSNRVLLLGAGPVGLELAGEIKARWPEKKVTLVDPERDILSGAFIPGFSQETRSRMRDELRRQLDSLGVELLLGTSMRAGVPAESGVSRPFTASTWSGQRVTADIWYRCFGRQPASGNVSRDLAGARRSDSRLTVTAHLRIVGQDNVFAIGDIAATGALDTAVVAIEQGTLAAENVKALINGESELSRYELSQPMFLVPLGPSGGASYDPQSDTILDSATTAEYKGKDLLISQYEQTMGIANG
ncbi:MAG TPA: FAD-dependent oxidoreductase [Candidatus Stackebrandtia faecavium]|nr:FAD-dependent oxidoreductase [Candidatus Stackebrandtia faecavium]